MKDERILAWDNVERGKMSPMSRAFCLRRDCRVEMGRLNSVPECWPASCDLHGLHTSPSVSEDTKKTASIDHLNHSVHSRR